MAKREPRSPKTQPGLPATYELGLVDLVTAAVERIEHQLSGPAHEYIAATMRDRLRRGLTDRRKVIDAALEGDHLAHDVLMAEFHDMLDRNEMPPASLRDYAAQRDKHPKRGRGRVWYDDWRRNYGFCLLIALVAEAFDLDPTRNRASAPPCACSLLEVALRRRGFKRGVSESRLTNLWGKLGDITIESIALQRAWPEITPYVGMSGDPALIDLKATFGPYQKKLLA